MWNKILRSRDFYVSKAFKDRLEIYTSSKGSMKKNEQSSDWILTDLESYISSLSPTVCKYEIPKIKDSDGGGVG